jgi:hypothetical protein
MDATVTGVAMIDQRERHFIVTLQHLPSVSEEGFIATKLQIEDSVTQVASCASAELSSCRLRDSRRENRRETCRSPATEPFVNARTLEKMGIMRVQSDERDGRVNTRRALPSEVRATEQSLGWPILPRKIDRR